VILWSNTLNMKKRKHQKLIDDYEGQKRKHLEKLATKSLENDEKMLKFKSKQINDKFLDLF
jgi:hypothetical protein